MVYFSQRFGYRVAGCDGSMRGLQLTVENLRLCGVEPIGVWRGKAEESGVLPSGFDVVASFGLVEHFADPMLVLESHAAAVKPGGYVIIGMPNITGINRIFQRVANPKPLLWHNTAVMNRAFLNDVARRFSLKSFSRTSSAGLRHRCIGLIGLHI
jgi:2-polyprenyl-3-methyl-5-hydroxy-6-metoxy-1,4-benzoquinol methylase